MGAQLQTFKSAPVLFLSLLSLTLFVSSSMTAIDNVLNRSLGLASTPEKINRYYAITFGAYAAKPVFALVSDWTLGKERRKFLTRAKFASGYCFFAAGFQFALSFAKTIEEVYAYGILMTVCVSGAYASLDGILVRAAKGGRGGETSSRRNEEEMRRIGGEMNATEEEVNAIENRTNNTKRRITQVNVQTVAMATRTFAAILGSACSVLFLEMFTARATIAMSSGYAVLAAILASRIKEDSGSSNGTGMQDLDEDLETRQRRRVDTMAATTTTSTKKWPWRRFFSDREFIALALALFLYRITPTAMDTYNSFIYSIYDNKLPNSAFGMFQFFSNVGALFGAFAFSFFHNKYLVEKKQQRDDETLPGRGGESRPSSSNYPNARNRQKQLLLQTPRSKMNVFLLGGLADVGFQLVRLFAIYHPPKINQSNSGVRAAITLSVLELIVSFGSRFAYMPIVILSAVVAEKCENKEAFSFSTLVFFADLSSIFAGFIAADIVERWKIGAAVKRKLDMMYITGRSWRPLKNFVYLCAFLKLAAVAATLLLLKFVLSRSDDEENEGEEYHHHHRSAPATQEEEEEEEEERGREREGQNSNSNNNVNDDQFSPYRIDR